VIRDLRPVKITAFLTFIGVLPLPPRYSQVSYLTVDFSLYLITDRRQIYEGRDLIEAVGQALAGGIRAVQLREKDLTAAELYPLALALRKLTRDFSAKLLINDRIDIALAVDADGVHLGAHSLPIVTARRLLGNDKLLGVSTHHFNEIEIASQARADFVTFGPVWHTPSKAAFGPPAGLEKLRRACTVSTLPVFALGGITADRIPEVFAAGAAGAGLISAILASSDPGGAAADLLSRMK
jgi:thiamine-phosphate pyrophosphorylase